MLNIIIFYRRETSCSSQVNKSEALEGVTAIEFGSIKLFYLSYLFLTHMKLEKCGFYNPFYPYFSLKHIRCEALEAVTASF